MNKSQNAFMKVYDDVMQDKRLSCFCVLLYSKIYALSGENGCFASNSYLGNILNHSDRSVSWGISRLKECGYIYVTEDKETQNRCRRLIFICQKEEEPEESKEGENNCEINAETAKCDEEKLSEGDSNTNSAECAQNIDNGDPELESLYKEYINFRKKQDNPLTSSALKLLVERCRELEPDNIENRKQLLKNALISGWKTVYPLKNSVNPAGNNAGGYSYGSGGNNAGGYSYGSGGYNGTWQTHNDWSQANQSSYSAGKNIERAYDLEAFERRSRMPIKYERKKRE